MEDEQAEPLLDGRSLLLVQDFCQATGLDPDTVQALLEGERLEGVFDLEGRAFGLFDDVLPSADDLENMGFTVNDSYEPEELQSYTDHDVSDEDSSGSEASTWFMSWGDGSQPA